VRIDLPYCCGRYGEDGGRLARARLFQ
jgi:hypothetical protein